MALNTAGLNVQANAFAAAATHLALHTADPGTTGTSSSAAARVTAGWAAAANGAVVASNKAFTGGAASGPVTHVGFWSAITGGTFYGSSPLTGDLTFNAAGEYNITTLTVSGS